MTHYTSLAVKIHQFTRFSTNIHIPMQENGNAVLAYRRHAAEDAHARRIAVRFLNMWQTACVPSDYRVLFLRVCNNTALRMYRMN